MAIVKQLVSILPNDRQNAMHAVDIATRLGLPTTGNQVETRQLIRDAIRAGYPIVSNTSVGYWISSNKNEVEEYITSLEDRADDTKQRANEVKKSWNTANPAEFIR